jgi:hypothetical protein
MDWFTNVTLFEKLVEKSNQDINVELVIYDDEVNRNHGFDISILNHTRIRATRRGIMHNKVV